MLIVVGTNLRILGGRLGVVALRLCVVDVLDELVLLCRSASETAALARLSGLVKILEVAVRGGTKLFRLLALLLLLCELLRRFSCEPPTLFAIIVDALDVGWMVRPEAVEYFALLALLFELFLAASCFEFELECDEFLSFEFFGSDFDFDDL